MSTISDSLKIKAQGTTPQPKLSQDVADIVQKGVQKGVKVTSTGTATKEKSSSRF